MVAAVLSVALTLALTLAAHRPEEHLITPPSDTEETPAAEPIPAPVLPIEVIDGELYIAIEVDGMPNESEE